MSTTNSTTAIQQADMPGEEWVSKEGYYKPYDFWLSTCGIYDLFSYALDLLGNVSGKQLLDCGCGRGHTSVMLARHGANVTGFDVSDDDLAKAHILAKANDVDVGFQHESFEALPFPDESFDLAFGAFILHHVDISRAVKEVHRILRPGGRAVFIENSDRNRLLMLSRRYLVGKMGIPKYGDDDEEHPLTSDDLERAKQDFSGITTVHHTDLLFFRLADFYMFEKRWKLLSSMLRGLDRFFARLLPVTRRYSYFQIIQFDKPADS